MHQQSKRQKKNIIILGGGYCGIQAAKTLSKHFKKLIDAKKIDENDYQIILIDRGSRHIYLAELYEISTAYYDQKTKKSELELDEALAFPLKITWNGKKVEFVQDEALEINPGKRSIKLKKGGELPYEYLVLAVGSVTNYYGIPGLQGNVYPLKTLSEALKINADLEKLIQESFASKKASNEQKPLHIIIGGGGFTGVELACELANFTKKLAQKYNFDPKKVTVKVIQAQAEMIGLGKKVSEYTLKRFDKMGIEWALNTTITAFESPLLKLKNTSTNEETVEKADMMIWTAGIMPNPLLKQSFESLHGSGCLETKSTLEALHYPHVYAGGDDAAILDPKTGKFVPKIGQLAIQHGVLIAENIAAKVAGQPEKDYKPLFKGFVIQMGGKYAVYCKGKIAFGGIIPWSMRKFVDMYYYLQILSPLKALKKWWKTENIFLQND